MGGFKLDTSGAVIVERGSVLTKYRWSDLSPFAQGYIKRAFESVEWPDPAEGFGPSGAPRFSDLAPATLAAMLEDCERFVSDPRCEDATALGERNGSMFWTLRKMGAGDTHGFPPLRLFLDDAWLIHQEVRR